MADTKIYIQQTRQGEAKWQSTGLEKELTQEQYEKQVADTGYQNRRNAVHQIRWVEKEETPA